MSPLVQQWSGLVWRQCSVMLDTSYKSQCTQQSAQPGHSGQGGCCEHLGAAAAPHPAPLSRYLQTRGREKSFLASTCGAARSAPPRGRGWRGCRWWRSGPRTPSCWGRAAASAIPRCRMFTVRMLQTGAAERGGSIQRWLLNTNIVFCIHVLITARPRAVLTASSAGLRAGPRQTPRPRRPHQPPRRRLPAGWRGSGEGQ